MSDVQSQLKFFAIGMLALSIFIAPVYSIWGFLHRGLPFMASYFTWVAAHTETMIALIVMIYVWAYMKDFKKIMIIGAIVYLIMLSPVGAQFLH